nr:MAG: hypothetical protein [uncultured archaeon]
MSGGTTFGQCKKHGDYCGNSCPFCKIEELEKTLLDHSHLTPTSELERWFEPIGLEIEKLRKGYSCEFVSIKERFEKLDNIEDIIRKLFKQKVEKGDWAIKCISPEEYNREKNMMDFIKDDINFYENLLKKLEEGLKT